MLSTSSLHVHLLRVLASPAGAGTWSLETSWSSTPIPWCVQRLREHFVLRQGSLQKRKGSICFEAPVPPDPIVGTDPKKAWVCSNRCNLVWLQDLPSFHRGNGHDGRVEDRKDTRSTCPCRFRRRLIPADQQPNFDRRHENTRCGGSASKAETHRLRLVQRKEGDRDKDSVEKMEASPRWFDETVRRNQGVCIVFYRGNWCQFCKA